MASVPEHLEHLRIEQVVAGGDGLARDPSGRVVFVPGVLPGERVDVRFVSAKRDFARGEIVRVVEPSPDRVAAPCDARARGCGGCDWQHVAPASQLALKADVVREALRRTARLPEAQVDTGGSVSSWGYRTSMRVAVDRHGAVALRRPRTNEPVALEHCLVAHPALDELVHSARFVGADEVSLRVSATTGERSAWWTRAHPGDEVMVSGLPDDVATGSDAVVHERVAGRELRVSGESFFQSGLEAAELLVRTVADVAGAALIGAAEVVDAYGGVGLFSTTLVPDTAHVTLVEGSAAACDDARHNLRAARSRHEVVRSSVERWRPDRADLVIADPSRQGLGPEAARALAATEAPVLVLVGCDPVAYARDAGLLAACGYRLVHSVAIDLFPQSHHVEVVGRFERDG
ncbi:MAG: TRAM domain-containing protein [Ilumatobacteraceae bacterium]|nr:class I SAM-dependent RNA methyltransferase [Acidimicrobiales bacterium]MCB9394606.1 class I SAM-dependent RNA methyltransferase [Acidimicrobiaceae bacterium]